MKISDMKAQAEAVRNFLLAWQQTPKTGHGLCTTSYLWMFNNGQPQFKDVVQNIIVSKFGPLIAYPFNENNGDLYGEEIRGNSCSQNPARRAWVTETLDEVTQHLALLGAQANVQP